MSKNLLRPGGFTNIPLHCKSHGRRASLQNRKVLEDVGAFVLYVLILIEHILQIAIALDTFSSILFYRKDDRVTIDRQNGGDLAISSHSIELRRRKREIIHIIHNATTMIEWLGIAMWFVCELLLFSGIDSYVSNSIALTANYTCAMVLVPFSHLFNEHRIKVMVLEEGWLFAIKQAIRFNIDSRVVPILNHSTGNPKNNGPSSKDFHAKVIGKFRNQTHSINPTQIPSKKMDRDTKSDIGSYEQKDGHDLPNQASTL